MTTTNKALKRQVADLKAEKSRILQLSREELGRKDAEIEALKAEARRMEAKHHADVTAITLEHYRRLSNAQSALEAYRRQERAVPRLGFFDRVLSFGEARS
jgi:hypothetical protein